MDGHRDKIQVAMSRLYVLGAWVDGGAGARRTVQVVPDRGHRLPCPLCPIGPAAGFIAWPGISGWTLAPAMCSGSSSEQFKIQRNFSTQSMKNYPQFSVYRPAVPQRVY